MYTPEEYRGEPANNPLLYKVPRIGWGHSTWQEGTRLAKTAGARQLILFHHDPEHNDLFLCNIEHQARQEFSNTLLAVEGLELVL
jgi:phosphoribosyl 1,2-cyclic phosphodiesterase